MDQHGHAVLIVEDHEVTRTTLARLLRLHLDGWEVLTAATIAEGLALVESEPSCVILDLMLPDGDGEIVLRRVREARLRTRVAVTTGTGDEARLEAVRRLGPEALLRKPVDPREIYEVCAAAAASWPPTSGAETSCPR
jgi:DNA-binding NarL/FixJ family response regulator